MKRLFGLAAAVEIFTSAGEDSQPASRQAKRRFMELFGVLHVCRPSWVRGQILAFLQN